MEYDKDRVDEMVLAFLYLTTFEYGRSPRAWKGTDREALNRLHEKGFIDNPKVRAKSIMLTGEGTDPSLCPL